MGKSPGPILARHASSPRFSSPRNSRVTALDRFDMVTSWEMIGKDIKHRCDITIFFWQKLVVDRKVKHKQNVDINCVHTPATGVCGHIHSAGSTEYVCPRTISLLILLSAPVPCPTLQSTLLLTVLSLALTIAAAFVVKCSAWAKWPRRQQRRARRRLRRLENLLV